MNDLDDIPLNRGSWAYRELIGQKIEWMPRQNPRNVSSDTRVNPLDGLIRCYATSNMLVTMETAIGADGRQHIVKNLGVSTLTISSFSSTEKIDGGGSISTVAIYDAYQLQSNGAGWDITDIIHNGGMGSGGSVTNVDQQLNRDITETLSGGPITGSGVLARTAVDPGHNALEGWVPAASSKVYLSLGTNLSVSTLSASTYALNATGSASSVAGVSSVALSSLKDATVTVSGSPVTSTGALTLTAVDPGASAIEGWIPAASSKVYVSLGTGLTVSTLSASTYALNAAGSSSATFGKETIYIPASAMTPTVTGGCASLASIAVGSSQPDITYLAFDTSTQEFCQFNTRMPKSWNQSTITYSYGFSHASTTTNFGVVFQLEAVAIPDGGSRAVSYGTAVSTAKTGGSTNNFYASPESSPLTIAGALSSQILVEFRGARVPANASDTLGIDARFEGISIYYTTNAATDD